MNRRIGAVRMAGVLIVAGLLVALLLAPLAALVRIAASAGWSTVASTIGSADTLTALRNTLLVSGAVTVLAVAGGTATALALRHRTARVRRWWRLAVLAPLLVPEFVLGYAWTQSYGPAGVTDHLFGLRLPGLFGPAGIALVLSVHALPLAYLAVSAGLAARAQPDLELAAHAAGAGPLTVLRTVTLPLLRLALLAAAALVFVTSVNSFAIPEVLGTPAGFHTLSTLIYTDLNLAADPNSFAQLTVLALGLAGLALVVVGVVDLTLGGLSPTLVWTSVGAGSAGRPRGRAGSWSAVLAGGYLVITTGIPLVVLVDTAITRGVGEPPVPANWTLVNFATAFTGEAGPALLRSLSLAAATALLVVVLSLLVIALGRRASGPAGTAVTLAYAVPGSALAVSVLVTYGRWLAGTVLILLAYLAKLWALGHRTLAGATARLDPDATRAARISGAGAVTALRTVVAPALNPALIAAAALVFVFALHELTMSSILYGPGSQTIAVAVLDQQQLGQLGPTSALAIVLTVPPLVVGLLVVRGRRALT